MLLGQGVVGFQRREGDVVHLVEKGLGRHRVARHQPRERRAVLGPVVIAQPVGLLGRDLERTDHEVAHAHLDLVEEPHLGRVERVVEVEDPGLDMGEVIAHGMGLRTGGGGCQGAPCLIAARGRGYPAGHATKGAAMSTLRASRRTPTG